MHSARTLLVVTALAGCYKDNPNFCDNAPLDNCNLFDAGPDMSTSCTNDMQCENADNAHVCDTRSGSCVQCTTDRPGACSDGTPVCDDGTLKCVACVEHADCTTTGGSTATSAVCIPSGPRQGACAAEGEVAYVEASGTGDTVGGCTKAQPCSNLADAIATAKTIVKFVGTATVADTTTTTITNKTVLIVADPGARLDVSVDNQSVLRITAMGGPASVEIHDLTMDVPIKLSGSTPFGAFAAYHVVVASAKEAATLEDLRNRATPPIRPSVGTPYMTKSGDRLFGVMAKLDPKTTAELYAVARTTTKAFAIAAPTTVKVGQPFNVRVTFLNPSTKPDKVAIVLQSPVSLPGDNARIPWDAVTRL